MTAELRSRDCVGVQAERVGQCTAGRRTSRCEGRRECAKDLTKALVMKLRVNISYLLCQQFHICDPNPHLLRKVTSGKSL